MTLVVASHADVDLRDELGNTLLHKAVLRKPTKVNPHFLFLIKLHIFIPGAAETAAWL